MYATGMHLTKNTLFDILSLADKLHHFKSTVSDGPKLEKIHFSKTVVLNLCKDGKAILYQEVERYYLSLNRNELLTIISNEYILEEEV